MVKAVDIFSANPHYAAILMDCMMPVMDGFEATANIRRIEKKPKRILASIPIIALTASVIDDDIQKCFDVGMDDYVRKPFKFEMLKEKILTAVEEEPLPPSSLTASTQASGKQAISAHSTVTPIHAAKQSLTLPETPEEDAVPSKSERILLVEDNRVNQGCLCDAQKSWLCF